MSAGCHVRARFCGPSIPPHKSDKAHPRSESISCTRIAGDGTLEARDRPAEIVALWMLGIVQISAGDNHSAALTADGRVLTWGRGKYGQLGTGSVETAAAPQLVPFPNHVTQVMPLPT